MRLDQIDPELTRGGKLRIVIETPKGSRNKYAFKAKAGGIILRKVLPEGMVLPFDFGFIPRTKGEDGDPVDILVLMDEPAFPGCIVPARVIGLIEATQTEGKTSVRNDRYLAVAESSLLHEEVSRRRAAYRAQGGRTLFCRL